MGTSIYYEDPNRQWLDYKRIVHRRVGERLPEDRDTNPHDVRPRHSDLLISDQRLIHHDAGLGAVHDHADHVRPVLQVEGKYPHASAARTGVIQPAKRSENLPRLLLGEFG